MSNVFISYARADAAFASSIAADLQRRGYTVIFDVEPIKHGSWADALESALEESKVVLCVLSPAYAASTWAQEELSLAMVRESARRLFVIPVLLQDCDAPMMLGSREAVDLRRYPAGVDALVAELHTHLPGGGSTRHGRSPAPELNEQPVNDRVPDTIRAEQSVRARADFGSGPTDAADGRGSASDKAVTSRSPRTTVFVSYSHRDQHLLDRLEVHLRPLENEGRIELWADTRLKSGDDWHSEIRAAINRARVAVILVSADFLASDFIAENELPPLLLQARHAGARIVPVIVGPCGYTRNRILSSFQAFNDPDRPLSDQTRADRERVWDAVAAEVFRLVHEE